MSFSVEHSDSGALYLRYRGNHHHVATTSRVRAEVLVDLDSSQELVGLEILSQAIPEPEA